MRIAITGFGVISALGVGREATKNALLNEKTGIGEIKNLPTVHRLPAGEVRQTNAELCEMLGLPTDAVVSRTTLLGAVAAREALAHAKIAQTADMALISGTTVGGMDTTEKFLQSWENGENLDYIKIHEAADSTTKIADYLGGFAFCTTPSTACSSALNSLILGANFLKTGRFERVLAGGSECLSKFHLNGFKSLMILDEENCRPFDASRRGLNLGEGAAYLVLETEESAKKRGAEILVYLSGYGNACDAFHQTASSDDGEGAYLAMNQALNSAKLRPNQINYINAHGTGTPNNDQSESAAVGRVFGENLPKISSTKSFTGHTTSASGSIESAICLICMKENFVPANLGWQNADNQTITPVIHNEKMALENVICNSFGFGGNNSSVIFSKNAPEEKLNSLINLNKNYEIVSEISLSADDEVDLKKYVSPAQSRRLTPQLRLILAAGKMALEQAGIEQVDAIITGTRWGCVDNSMQFLQELLASNEQAQKPTFFMQSTHNTPSSLVAISLKCHGYNCTYSHAEKSFEHALLDAQIQLELGQISSALVLGFDEENAHWQALLERCGEEKAFPMARALVIKNC